MRNWLALPPGDHETLCAEGKTIIHAEAGVTEGRIESAIRLFVEITDKKEG